MKQNKIRKEEIYLCKKCECPLSHLSAEKNIYQIYGDNVLSKVSDERINLNLVKCILVASPDDESLEKDYNYGINKKQKKIFCKNCKTNLGFIIDIDKNIMGFSLILGFFNNDKIEINKIGFKNKKEEIEVISQSRYTVLSKLKQLRYYVKQLSPILKESMDFVNAERNTIDEYAEKFNNYKLNEVFNEIEKIEKNKEKE